MSFLSPFVGYYNRIRLKAILEMFEESWQSYSTRFAPWLMFCYWSLIVRIFELISLIYALRFFRQISTNAVCRISCRFARENNPISRFCAQNNPTLKLFYSKELFSLLKHPVKCETSIANYSLYVTMSLIVISIHFR